jgi:hypothetical protein
LIIFFAFLSGNTPKLFNVLEHPIRDESKHCIAVVSSQTWLHGNPAMDYALEKKA